MAKATTMKTLFRVAMSPRNINRTQTSLERPNKLTVIGQFHTSYLVPSMVLIVSVMTLQAGKETAIWLVIALCIMDMVVYGYVVVISWYNQEFIILLL